MGKSKREITSDFNAFKKQLEEITKQKAYEDQLAAYNDAMKEFQYQESLRQISYQKKIQDSINKVSLKNEKGEIVGSPMDQARKAGEQISNTETAAYNSEWKIAMQQMLGAYVQFAEAIYADLQTAGITIYEKEDFETGKTKRIRFENFTVNNLQHQIFEQVRQLSSQPTPPKLDELANLALPMLKPKVSVEEDGKLHVELDLEGLPKSQELNDLFTKIYANWLDTKGYIPGSDGKYLHNGDPDKPLTRHDLERLSSEDENFQYFFNTQFPEVSLRLSM